MLLKELVLRKKVIYTLLCITLIFQSLTMIPFSYLSKYIVDDVLISKDMKNIGGVLITFLILMVLQSIISRVAARLNVNFFQEGLYFLRNQVFHSAISDSDISHQKISNIQTAIFSDIDNLISNYTTITVSIFSNVTLVIGYLSLMIYTNITLSFITLALIPFQIIWVSISTKRLKRYQHECQRQRDILQDSLNRNILNVPTIHVYNYFSKVESIFLKKTKSVSNANSEILLFQNYVQIVSQFILLLIQFAPLFIGSYYVFKGTLTIGALIAFNSMSVQLISPASNLVNLMNSLKIAKVHEERLIPYLIKKEMYFPDNHQVECVDNSNLMYIRDYRLYSNKKEIIRINELKIGKGERILIKGGNGTGKSLFLKSLVRLYKNYKGIINLRGQDISLMSHSALSSSIVYVSENDGFILETLKDELNITEQNNFFKGIFQLLNLSNIIEKLNNGIKTECGLLDANLSTGEIQKLRIARAILRNPKIIILDEVFTNIDEKSRNTILTELPKLCFGTTFIFVEHHIDEVYFDRVLSIEGDNIIETVPDDRKEGLANENASPIFGI
ncbi:ABC transporter transmembrane domain-containing protein [Candidatus Enterococcus courvalinii]|uniref:ABC transporter ATP-binding protein n=1 Tax=Candidatus Enterococcus courvalinii TaxID=2815329 RepID=A0ABS3I0F2_9ENTE|nr:ABC transporter ATP-binding protein [Enterococcus sp. MSG2901]MBO0482198.1 ABC transporter ATP-binding protein [Enterococcus sp. MSG2901]